MERWLSSERNVRICAVLGAVAIAFSSILVRLSHASPSTAAIFRCVYALPALGLLALYEDRRFGRRVWRERAIAIGSGVFFAADLLLWHRSIADVGAGLATVLANIQVVLVPLVAWVLLAERPGGRVLAALPLALVGVLMISGTLEHGAYGRDPVRGTVFGLGAGVAYVGFLLLLRRGGADLRRPAGPLFDATATAAVLCVVAGTAIGDARLVPAWPSAGWLITLALTSQVLGWLLITSSLPRLPAALTSLLLTVQPIGSVALAALIFAEAPSPLQLVGVAMVLAALLTATLPRRRKGGAGPGPEQAPATPGQAPATPGQAPATPAQAPATPAPSVQAIAGASGNRSSAACISSSENSGSSSSPARNAS